MKAQIWFFLEYFILKWQFYYYCDTILIFRFCRSSNTNIVTRESRSWNILFFFTIRDIVFWRTIVFPKIFLSSASFAMIAKWICLSLIGKVVNEIVQIYTSLYTVLKIADCSQNRTQTKQNEIEWIYSSFFWVNLLINLLKLISELYADEYNERANEWKNAKIVPTPKGEKTNERLKKQANQSQSINPTE